MANDADHTPQLVSACKCPSKCGGRCGECVVRVVWDGVGNMRNVRSGSVGVCRVCGVWDVWEQLCMSQVKTFTAHM